MSELTAAQQKFIELEKKKADIKQYFADLAQATQEVVAEIGMGAFFQDEEGTVYKTAAAIGEFVHYKSIEIVRTRRSGERNGTLSLTDAKDAGFEVK